MVSIWSPLSTLCMPENKIAAVSFCWPDSRWHVYCTFMLWLCTSQWKVIPFFSLTPRNDGQISTYLKQTSRNFHETNKKRKKEKKYRKKKHLAVLWFWMPFLPPFSASIWAWKHLNTKFSELFCHSSLRGMTSDSSEDKVQMSVSAWVFTNLLSDTAFQFWKHYHMQVPLTTVKTTGLIFPLEQSDKCAHENVLKYIERVEEVQFVPSYRTSGSTESSCRSHLAAAQHWWDFGSAMHYGLIWITEMHLWSECVRLLQALYKTCV